MLIEIDFNSDEAIYIQLRNQIIMGIATSTIHEGDTLPSVRQLADNIGINMHTVNKAYNVLRQEGFLQLDRRRGAVICIDEDKLEALQDLKEQLSGLDLGEKLLIPCSMLKGDEEIFLDDMTLEELSDIKTAVSEAVTNAIIHGYEIYGVEEEELLAEKITEGLAVMPQVFLHGRIEGDVLELLIRDEGCGIADIEQAMEPLYTTKPDLDRSGMGFSFMEAFMDDLEVESVLGQGTTVHMKKKLGTTSWIEQEE